MYAAVDAGRADAAGTPARWYPRIFAYGWHCPAPASRQDSHKNL